jgi:hypothetical protein
VQAGFAPAFCVADFVRLILRAWQCDAFVTGLMHRPAHLPSPHHRVLDGWGRVESVLMVVGAKFGLAACVVVSFALAGCGGRPDGVLVPVAAGTAGTSSVDMLVATTRRSVADPGQMFSGERDQALNYADIRISIPPMPSARPAKCNGRRGNLVRAMAIRRASSWR